MSRARTPVAEAPRTGAAQAKPARAAGLEPSLPFRPQRGLDVGFLAMLPLFLAYELGLAGRADLLRNSSELCLTYVLTPLGPEQHAARWLALGGAALWALWSARARRAEIGSLVSRCILEGIVGALCLGPLLIGLAALFDGFVPFFAGEWGRPSSSPSLAAAGALLGGAAWEELLFRIGLYGAIFVVLRALFGFARARGPAAEFSAELGALVGSSLCFAAAHVDRWIAWLGPGGEPFDLELFAWRAFAGLFLALIFRWRGPGVAAWTHGLFNMGLELGFGVDVLR